MLRHALVCLEGGARNDAVLATASRFATGYGAFLSGLYVREPAPLPYPPTGDPVFPTFPPPHVLETYQQQVDAHERAQDHLQAAAYHSFDEECRRAGIEGRMSTRVGNPKEAIPAGARNTDLVIFGRGRREDSTLGSLSGWLVRNLARPVLLVGEPLRRLTRIAVAYDASHGGERALALCADVAARWRNAPVFVDLLHAKSEEATADPDVESAERYLDIYELEHATRSFVGRAADVIVDQAELIDADLIVMGAYGHSLVREVLLGSTTQAVIARWRRPILLWR